MTGRPPKRLPLTPEQEAIVREVLARNHAYYRRNYGMPKPCMDPDEVLWEICCALRRPGLQQLPGRREPKP